MRATISLGRIAGVRVGVHWSVLFILALIALGLAEGRLPRTYPGESRAVYWSIGLVTAMVFLALLLAHELAHAVVARRNEVGVDDITLWLLGGVARLRTEARTPAAELRIAGAGPLVSLALGAFFALVAWLLGQTGAPGPVVEALAWLAAINIVLAVFNAIPAAPLDGGRLLRAFLWWRTGDRLRAAAGAAAAGRGFGWFLMLLGVLLFARGDIVGGLWLVMIAWFLVAAATVEGRQAQLRAVLAGVPVRDAMTPDPVAVPARLTVADFLADPRYRYRHTAFPVTGEGRVPLGLLTLDGARKVPEARRQAMTAEQAMTPLPDVTVVDAGDPLADLLPELVPGAENRALVTEGGLLAGIVSASDVSRAVSWLMAARKSGGRTGREGG
ncbi:site-2 protease family protein [Streptomyces sp. HK10]|uniref:site-2 protease family protein n=1 Tax=Streptomyces sp. HK10 TaxID=3373255 RepID=UPI00374975C9